MKTGLYLLIIFLALSAAVPVMAAETDAQLKADLYKELEAFAKQHSVGETTVEKILGEIVLDEKKMVIGRVGVINKHDFILLKEPRNALVLNGRKWEGKKANEQEVVLTDGKSALESLQGADMAKVVIVMFSPTEVRFIDLANSVAGRYARE